MTPHFRTATPADTDLILELMREFYLVEHIRFDPEKARRAVEQILGSPRYGMIIIISRRNKDIVGYFVLTWGFSLEYGGRDALLDELYIRESFRGEGIGKVALRMVEEICREEKIIAVHLQVDRANEGAQRLYRSLGYDDHGRDFLTKMVR